MQNNSSTDSSIKQKFHLHNSRVQIYAENAIKRSNVKNFINQGAHTSQRLNLQNNENKNLSQHLLHLKNSCNDLKKDITNKQNESIKLKDQAIYTTEKVKQLQQQRQKLEQKINNLLKDVQMVQVKKQSTFHTYKTYEHILWRMKKDQITNQIRRNNLQKQIVNMEKQLKLVQNKLYSLKEYEQLSYKGLKQATKQIKYQNQQRNKKILQMNNVLQDKKISQIKKQQRYQQTKSIQQMAAGDLQDSDLIRIKKFFQVQMFLKYMLKDKMQRLKDYYQPYEMAFFKIKSQTCAKDANSLKTQFFNFQSQYQQKTSFIKSLQQQISNLQKQRKDLNEQYIKTKENQLDILQEFQGKHSVEQKKYDEEGNECVKVQDDRQHICKKAMDSQLTLMKLKEWTYFQSKRMGLATNNQTNSGVIFNKICSFLIEKKTSQNAIKTKSQQNVEKQVQTKC